MNSLWVERLVVVFLLLLFFCILCIFHNGRYYFDGYKGKKTLMTLRLQTGASPARACPARVAAKCEVCMSSPVCPRSEQG